MENKKVKRTQSDEVPTLNVPIDVLLEQNEQQTWSPGDQATRYVVTRGGLRVSDKDYPKANEQRAIAEKEFWQRVVNRYPDGTKIEIVQYDKKKHRIW